MNTYTESESNEIFSSSGNGRRTAAAEVSLLSPVATTPKKSTKPQAVAQWLIPFPCLGNCNFAKADGDPKRDGWERRVEEMDGDELDHHHHLQQQKKLAQVAMLSYDRSKDIVTRMAENTDINFRPFADRPRENGHFQSGGVH